MQATVRHLVVVSLIIVTSLLAAAAVAQAPAAAQADAPGRTSTVDCPVSVPDNVAIECGQLSVPEDYSEPDGREVDLPYIILGRRGGAAQPDPVVFTAGGPGYSSLDSVWAFSRSPILDQRDVVIVEQRGNRFADPALMCGASVWWTEHPGDTACLDSLLVDGLDISQYTTGNMINDLVALRESLGYEQWNLYGSSFSTSLMLLAMETDPQGTRSAVLQSVKPPSETIFAHESDVPLRAIDAVFAACGADERCGSAFPDLEEQFLTVVRRLNQEPVLLEVTRRGDDEPVPVELDGDRFIDWVVIDQLYDPVFPEHGAAYLPMVIDKAAGGDMEPLTRVAQSFWSTSLEDPNWAWGLMFAVNCQQDLPAAGATRSSADLAAAERLDGFARSTGQRAICDAWGLPARQPAADHYIESGIPSLVLAGSFDPVTPPSWSRTTADHLSSGTYVEFGGHGHDVNADNPCATRLIVAFFDDPEAELDTSCVLDAPKPSFVVPGDVYDAPGLAASADEVSIGDPAGVAWIEALVLASVLGSLGAAIGLIGFVGWRLGSGLRHEGPAWPEGGAPWLAGGLALLIALAVLAVPVLMTAVNDELAGSSAIGFALGPRRDLFPATVLAWLVPITAVATAILLVLTGRAWTTGGWSRILRILTTFTAIAALPMLVLAVRWDLYTMLA